CGVPTDKGPTNTPSTRIRQGKSQENTEHTAHGLLSPYAYFYCTQQNDSSAKNNRRRAPPRYVASKFSIGIEADVSSVPVKEVARTSHQFTRQPTCYTDITYLNNLFFAATTTFRRKGTITVLKPMLNKYYSAKVSPQAKTKQNMEYALFPCARSYVVFAGPLASSTHRPNSSRISARSTWSAPNLASLISSPRENNASASSGRPTSRAHRPISCSVAATCISSRPNLASKISSARVNNASASPGRPASHTRAHLVQPVGHFQIVGPQLGLLDLQRTRIQRFRLPRPP
ncbi:unnamed protein product, partial [Ectocarpus fasciculatus]